MKRERLERYLPRREREHAPEESYCATSRLDIARLLLEVAQFAADIYDRWQARRESSEEAEMSPAEAREYAAEILAAADKAEADNRDGGEEWNAP
jgi:hypothetical protein